MLLLQQEQALNWLFSLESPALILVTAGCVVLIYALKAKDKKLDEINQKYVELLEKVITVVGGNTSSLDALRGNVIDTSGKLEDELRRCSHSTKNVAQEIVMLRTVLGVKKAQPASDSLNED